MNLKEIAKELNVSPSTVSIVFNKKEGVAEETRQKVLAALRENGYTPVSSIKRSRKRSDNMSIRFLKYAKHSLVVDGNEGFVSSIIDSAEQEARKRGYNFIINSFSDDVMDDVFDMVRTEPFSGVILLGTEFEESDYHYLNNLSVPVIVVDNRFEFYPIDSVTMNNTDIVYNAVRHLWDLGHREIGYLHSKIRIANFEERYRAFHMSFEKLGLPANVDRIFPVSATMQGSYQSVIELLQKGTSFPPAVFADNDSIAMGAIKAFREFNYRIPDDISIVGFDDIPFCQMIEPQLTTMRVPTEDIGRWTVHRLCQRIANPKIPIMKMQFGAELICRQSACSPARNE